MIYFLYNQTNSKSVRNTLWYNPNYSIIRDWIIRHAVGATAWQDIINRTP